MKPTLQTALQSEQTVVSQIITISSIDILGKGVHFRKLFSLRSNLTCDLNFMTSNPLLLLYRIPNCTVPLVSYFQEFPLLNRE